ncbi:hypothetical protein VTP01DRAFT_5939 [Rhizomucor pusillus]|uniref:uncharacterized protein n=1 Tax=Rhizomucor pusillus TaxID=4840 RepID=UPI0037439615
MHNVTLRIVDCCLTDIEQTGHISQETARRLYLIFGETFLQALHLLDTRSVSKITCHAGRTVFRIYDKYPSSVTKQNAKDNVGENTYQLPEPSNAPDSSEHAEPQPRATFICQLQPQYCNCIAFMQNVLCNKDMMMCRHILAIVLAEYFGYETQVLSDEAFAELIYAWDEKL